MERHRDTHLKRTGAQGQRSGPGVVNQSQKGAVPCAPQSPVTHSGGGCAQTRRRPRRPLSVAGQDWRRSRGRSNWRRHMRCPCSTFCMVVFANHMCIEPQSPKPGSTCKSTAQTQAKEPACMPNGATFERGARRRLLNISMEPLNLRPLSTASALQSAAGAGTGRAPCPSQWAPPAARPLAAGSRPPC